VSVEIEVVEDPARACSAMLVGAAARGGHIVLSGGSSPQAAYQHLVDAVRAVDLDISRTTIWFGDERCVPPDDDRSNFKMVKEALLDPLSDRSLPAVHRIRGELGPQAAADEYERELRDAGPPQFDLMLLGVGPDGHTQSMFPDQSSLQERSRLVLGVEQAGFEPFVPRVTMTFPALALSKQLVVLAAGESKAGPIAAAFGPQATPDPHVPSSIVPTLGREVIVLLDQAAAQGLRLDAGAEGP
jgi:6-phosphogluconolactonase